jgi:methylated-DNA-[protein]-cysteine S-methyltransferase
MSASAPSYAIAETPIGALLLIGAASALHRIDFAGTWHDADIDPTWQRGNDVLDATRLQLSEYFAGTRRAFDLPLAPQGTPFQRRVWDQLRQIDYGATTSYAEIARRLGEPRAVRAVGAANGRNPIPIVIPCHRVIGSDGRLTGFGGGLPLKRRLLELEQRSIPFALA